ncbi:MAG: histidine-type phosphatase [Bacteroidales bacterium]|nr:histidine-type phosphatase [Bacteroidales bacterium]
MKKYLIILALAAGQLCAAQPDFEQYPNPEFAKMIYEQPWIANLNACPYELAITPGKLSKAPRGYKPFYISHYGRHGSRSGWDQDKYEIIIGALTKAKEDGILSASGDSLLQETILVKEATNKMDGRLTVRGQREHREIADRMYKNFRRVFRRGSHNIRATSSIVPRCIVSMAAFTNRLSELNQNLNIVMDCGEEIQKEVSNDRGHEITTNRRIIMDTIRSAMNRDCSAMMSRLFTDVEAAGKIVEDPFRLSHAICSVARISRSFDFDFNTYRFVPFDIIYEWADYHNLYMYVGECNSLEFGDIRMERTEPLVRMIVRQADDALANGNVAADIRFGHDYPLMALCSYIGVEGISERYDWREAQKHFISTFYAPFAGNLQLIFYRSRKADKPVLVKVLMNEREVHLNGLEPVQGMYYSWEELREKISC